MANQVVNTAICNCTFGAAPGTLNVPPAACVTACGLPAVMPCAPAVIPALMSPAISPAGRLWAISSGRCADMKFKKQTW